MIKTIASFRVADHLPAPGFVAEVAGIVLVTGEVQVVTCPASRPATCLETW